VHVLETSMNLDDLRTFLAIAKSGNVRAAAEAMHQSASALSKALKRLEQSLSTPLFDRVGKSIQLNAQGQQLRPRALELISLAEQTAQNFRGDTGSAHCRVVGPAVLQWRFGPVLSARLRARQKNAGVAFVSAFEDAAVQAVVRAEADFALVTGAAINASLPVGLQAVAIGSISMQLAAGAAHPLVQKLPASRRSASAVTLKTADVLAYDFACPSRSMFCGLERGARSDGWRDDQLPRRIRFWLEDLQLLIALVQAGQALAYLPDFALSAPNLLRLKLSDCPYQCVEQAFLLWRPARATGWQNILVDELTKSAKFNQ
jgi:DNA-binding transcriptional LysR family regulator